MSEYSPEDGRAWEREFESICRERGTTLWEPASACDYDFIAAYYIRIQCKLALARQRKKDRRLTYKICSGRGYQYTFDAFDLLALKCRATSRRFIVPAKHLRSPVKPGCMGMHFTIETFEPFEDAWDLVNTPSVKINGAIAVPVKQKLRGPDVPEWLHGLEET